MSLILEALRKSEERRKLGEAPTLASESAWSARRRHPLAQRDRRPLWLLLAVVVIAVPAAGWWWSTRTTAPVAATRQAQAARTPTRALPLPAASDPPAVPAAVATPVPTPAPAIVATTAPAPVPPAATDGGAQEPFQQMTPPAPATVVEPVPSPAIEPTASAPTASAPAATPVVPPAATPAAMPAATPAPAAAAPVAGDVPQIWQLSLPTRQALPPLALTMHVYAEEPAQRFAIVNDKRIAEGSPLDNDLNVREIRPDGVVLEFRGQRFLLPRNGR